MKFTLSTEKKLWNPEIRITHLNKNNFKYKTKQNTFVFLFFLLFLVLCSFPSFKYFNFEPVQVLFENTQLSEKNFLLEEKEKEEVFTEDHSIFSNSIFLYSDEIKKDVDKNEGHSEFKPFIWKGEKKEGSALTPEKIIQCINEIEDIFEYTISKNLKILIIETMAIESHFGRTIGKTNKSAQGVLQILPSTHKYVVEDLSKKKKYMEFYDALQKVTDHSLSPEKNLRYNIHYGIVFFLWYMEHREGVLALESEKPPLLNSIERRWTIYQAGWNANHKKATIIKPFYVTRAKEASALFTTINFN